MLLLNIEKVRKLKKLSQEDLAKLTGLSQSYICGLETSPKGKNPTLRTINQIANALGICPHELLTCDCSKCKGE